MNENSKHNLCTGDVGTVWGIFWITFQLAWLVGFVLIDIASFHLLLDQMGEQAGTLSETLATRPSDDRHESLPCLSLLFLFFTSVLPPDIVRRKRHCPHFSSGIFTIISSVGILLVLLEVWYGQPLYYDYDGDEEQCAAPCVAVILLPSHIYRGWVRPRLLVVLPGMAQ